MDILVVASDRAKSQIIFAGLELSGYQNRVISLNEVHEIHQSVKTHAPLLIVYLTSPDDPPQLVAYFEQLHDVPLLTIGSHAEKSNGSLPLPYQFQDLLQRVNRYVPLPADFLNPAYRHFASQAEEEHKYRDLFDRASDAILLIDYETHCIIDANQQAVKLYGYRLDELIGMSMLQMVPAEQHPNMLENTRKMNADREIIHVPRRTHIAKDGALITVSISAAIIEYGGRTVFQDIIRNETERIRYEEELKELVQLKDQFVSNISHELRTPIANLRLHEYLLSKQPENLAQHLAVLERETTRLNRLIEDLLVLSRLDQGRQDIIFEKVDLNQLVQQHLGDRQLLAQKSGITLKDELTPLIPPVEGSPDMLDQVLSIMLTNAINYTPSGGSVIVSTHPTELEGKQWIGFSITDTGYGIPPVEQHLLFTRFYRGSAAYQSAQTGTGLGLAIAKEIIDRHNGHITVKSDGIPGNGTTFGVWFPRFSSLS